ncbi:cysteine desulfurase family protein [Nocardioides sp. zg-1228]|uniref:cysteine desulfurase family protein n=1 Tax=Nocardioides sp. zg-1228 TaxID=2763008 RepID=UPI0016424DC3|nr:aminotransferase class V-fold PLP-dependent enzyme [Nocardioides sp. zg-1228]MBC2933450.1 aminotransferase class V-fold PLP-dependent enzyme [Nocardioides sp. zg-1228]QSF56404.1 aminotransferase class V-fold PLP-dependent enzyme [Nocardioides sp. zg-1228]
MTAPPAGPGDLDSASSAPLHPAAREVLLAALERGYADPRRLHRPGREARLLLDNAREATADALGVRADEVTFTPSGTHAVHLGLLGLVRGSRRGDGVAHSAVEHSAVRHAVAWGARAVEVGTDMHGRVRPDHLLEAARSPGVGTVALQTANHEVGTVQPIDELALPDDVALFTDACASMGRCALPEGWAAAAGSAHKWGGPAGVGVLLVRKRARWRPPFPGDDRVDERSTGFENVPAVLAAAAALQAVVAEREEVGARQHALVDVVRRRVAAEVPDVEVVGDPERRLPHLVTFSCLYVDGEALVGELDRRGFGIASGSACTASTLTPSHVLEAMGVLTHGNVRLSLQRDTSRAEVDAFCDALPGVVAEIRSRVGM